MTRTTTAAAPAPRNGRNGKVHTVKVDPATLATATAAELAAPTLPETIAPAPANLPDDLTAAIAAAQQAAAQRRQKVQRNPVARIKVSAQEATALAAAGWKAPYATADNQWKPEPRNRQNACQGDTAYMAALAVMVSRPLKVTELATLWVATGNKPRTLAGIAQQLANRSQKTIQQKGGILSLT